MRGEIRKAAGLTASKLTSQWASSSADAPAKVGSVVDILGELAEDDVEWLLTAGRCRELQAGEFLITRGLEADGLFERWVRKFCDVGNPYRIQRLATLGGGFREDPDPGAELGPDGMLRISANGTKRTCKPR